MPEPTQTVPCPCVPCPCSPSWSHPQGNQYYTLNFLDSVDDCKAAAQALNLPSSQVFKYQSNAANKDTTPYGCWWNPANSGNYRLFFNPYGRKTYRQGEDLTHQSLCSKHDVGAVEA